MDLLARPANMERSPGITPRTRTRCSGACSCGVDTDIPFMPNGTAFYTWTHKNHPVIALMTRADGRVGKLEDVWQGLPVELPQG